MVPGQLCGHAAGAQDRHEAYLRVPTHAVTEAKTARIDIKLDGQTVTSIYSLAGECATPQQHITKTRATGACKWGLNLDALWFWDYGQDELVPNGTLQWGVGNYWIF